MTELERTSRRLSEAAKTHLAALGLFATVTSDVLDTALAGATKDVDLQLALRAWIVRHAEGTPAELEVAARAAGRALWGIGWEPAHRTIEALRSELKRCAFAQPSVALAATVHAIDELLAPAASLLLEAQAAATTTKLDQHARLVTIGQVTASIGHDLRNPLGVIESSLFLLRRKAAANDLMLRHLDKIGRQVKVCNQIVTDLLDLARAGPPKLELLDPADLFAASIDAANLPEQDLRFETHAPKDLRFIADPGLLTRALVNLMTNAARALDPRPGTITLAASLDDDDVIHLRVSDDGPGFDPDILSTAFEPLVTGHAKGIGLGLALVGAIAERHQGRAVAYNGSDRGASVELMFPRKMRGVPT